VRRTVLVMVQFVVVLGLVGVFAVEARSDYADDHAGRCASLTLNGGGVLVGTNGNDCIAGSNGPDVVRAKAGDDVVAGNHGFDVLKGSSGDDRLWGGRGPDHFRCGPGYDVVHNNRSTGADAIGEDCEVVRP